MENDIQGRRVVSRGNNKEVQEDLRRGLSMENVEETQEERRRRISKTKISIIENQQTFKNDSRTIDFILVWDENDGTSRETSSYQKREIYESNLCDEGLEIEHQFSQDTGLHYVKIHAPLEVLRRYAEIMKLRLPMRKELISSYKYSKQSSWAQMSHYIAEKVPKIKKAHNLFGNMCSWASDWLKNNIYVDKTVFPDCKQRFTAIYSRDKEYLFDSANPLFFSPANKARICRFILDRTFFKETDAPDVFSFGIERLKSASIYAAAYPLHDGDLDTPGTLRYKLYHHWASVKKWYRYQPIDYVRHYFGVKIGLYFAWLGFYTYMLFPASIVGLACFFYSLFILQRDYYTSDICSGTMKTKMCPKCDYFCHFWDIQQTCSYSKVLFLFDNYTTVFVAVFMSFWAALFLELWKRYSAEITHRWDLTGYETQEEHPRPQYLAHLARLDAENKTKYRVNVITLNLEPRVPFWKIKFPHRVLSFSVILLLVSLALATVIGVVMYRMSVSTALSVVGNPVISSNAMFITSTTAAMIDLVTIFIFNWLYGQLAEYLTELELLRTQAEFDDALTLKMYLLQFVNYYASIFYIAFCKGKLIGSPHKYNRFFGSRQEECGPAGCLLELSIQLSVIMVGKQAFTTIIEMVSPMFKRWWKTRCVTQNRPLEQWEKDYQLAEWGTRSLFPEYLEMIIQYGFVTIFVSAFPLAPFFALLNNILESRLDAKKLLVFHRRPFPQRVKNIGVWFSILNTVSKLAVISNAFIIAFTSDFIPRLVYRVAISSDNSLKGYLNHSLSYISIDDLDMYGKPNTTLKYCRYKDYREPAWSDNKYETTMMYWHVMAARLLFVVLFENIVISVVVLVGWFTSEVPSKLKEQLRREKYFINEIIIRQARYERDKILGLNKNPQNDTQKNNSKTLRERRSKKKRLSLNEQFQLSKEPASESSDYKRTKK